jgi:hypothetical protein
MKPSVRVGEAALREVAAYLLDYRGFAGIPPACLVLCRHAKLNYTVTVPRIESMADFAFIPQQRHSGDDYTGFGSFRLILRRYMHCTDYSVI